MTQDRALLRPARLAVTHSVFTQDRAGGGWSEAPREDSNTLATAVQLLSLKTSHEAYIEVPGAAIVGASNFFDSVQQNEGAIYGYDEAGDDPTATAAALLCRIHLGWRREHPALQRGVASLAEAGPSETDMLFNLYANQVLFHYGGEHWEAWNRELRDWLLEAQSTEGDTAGSWQFERDESEHADPAAGDRLHDTCLAALILQVYYRQLPLYAETDD